MNSLWQDLRFGLRLLRKSPGFTAIAVLCLALGIGANATIFGFINAFVLRPLPVFEPGRLVWLMIRFGEGEGLAPFSYPIYRDLRDQNDAFSGLATRASASATIDGVAGAEQVSGELVSANYFSVLGVQAAHGRTFLPEEDAAPGEHSVVLLSHTCWRNRFGSDATLLGQTIDLNERPFTVIGILPRSFRGIEAGQASEFWVPMASIAALSSGSAEDLERRSFFWLDVIGRLKPGITARQAEESLRPLTVDLALDHPGTVRTAGVALFPARGGKPLDNQRMLPVAGLLLAVVGLVLLIACANVANLLLARAMARRREIGIRLALGASRGRLIRQMLTEGALLSLMGGVGGLLVAMWASDLVIACLPAAVRPVGLDLTPDVRVVGFTLLLSIITAFVFGLVPALHASRTSVVATIKDEAISPGRGLLRSRLRSSLVVLQASVSLVLLISAGLLLRSLNQAQRTDPGFDAKNLLVLPLELDAERYPAPEARQFYTQVLERVRQLPGVESACAATVAPVSGVAGIYGVRLEGSSPEDGPPLEVAVSVVTPGYFETLRMPWVRGRDFEEQDREGAPGVAIVNEACVRRFWPGTDGLGKRLIIPGPEAGTLVEVTGVVRDSKYHRLTEDPEPILYLPYLQNYSDQLARMQFLVRTPSEPGQVLAAFRQQVADLDSSTRPREVRTMVEMLEISLADQRMIAWLLGGFGCLALLLAAIGLYGVVGYSVNQRVQEIGIRMALGAEPGHVFRLITGQALHLAFLGVGLGLLGAFAATRVLGSWLFGVSPLDPPTFAAMSCILVGVAVLASWFPARRAMRVDPMTALRTK